MFDHKKYSVNDPDYSPLFFGNYGIFLMRNMLRDFEETMNDPDAHLRDHGQGYLRAGTYLVQTKYRYIRIAYLCFFTGLIVSTLIYFIQHFP